jgi:asparagine synthase (glutamine-hydrolysing)
MYTDLRNYLSESVLVKVDRMTMAHGIEARSPLLDHRLVELAARMPGAWKRPPGSAGKQPLRQLAAQLFPAKLIDRPKRGFDIPMKSWMSGGPLRRSIEEVLRESLLVRDGWLAKGPLLAEIAPDRDGMARLGNRIWSLYILELWYRQRRA